MQAVDMGRRQAEECTSPAETAALAEASAQVKPTAITWAPMGWLPHHTSSQLRPERAP